MKELELKYGCNPEPEAVQNFYGETANSPIQVLCGKPGYINFLDAFNGWQCSCELKRQPVFRQQPPSSMFRRQGRQ